MDIIGLLEFAKKENASDIHISSGEPLMIRIHGEIRKIDTPPLNKEEVHKILYDILNDQQRKIYEEFHELDFAIAFSDTGRFRVNAFLQQRGDSIVFRTIPTTIPTLEQLGVPKIIEDLTKKRKRTHSRNRSDRLRQVNDTGCNDQPYQPRGKMSYPHH